MKVSAIPAQITTVEDRIAGNLNLTQLILLAAPLFFSALIFLIFPPFGGYSIFKLLIITVFAISSSVLAIRIKDKLVIDVLKQMLNYKIRPHIYVYRKQYLQPEQIVLPESRHYLQGTILTQNAPAELSTKARINGNKLLADREFNVAFMSKSGGLIVKVSTLQ